MTTKLTLYNLACYLLKETKLEGLTEEREARRVLDDLYLPTLYECLEEGFWNFAMRTTQMEADPNFTPAIYYQYAFDKPDDWVKTYMLALSESLRDSGPVDVVDETGFWYANFNPLYVKYVSKDAAYGMNLTLYPATYENYVAHRLAVRGCRGIKGADPSDDLLKSESKARVSAKVKDAMNEPPKEKPLNSWVRGRLGNRTSPGRGGRYC